MYLYLYLFQDTSSSALPGAMIWQTVECQAARSCVCGAHISSHCLSHLRPCRRKPPIGSRSALSVLSQVLTCPPRFFFQCARGLQYSAFLVRVSSDLRQTWPNQVRRRFFIRASMSCFWWHRLRISTLLILSRRETPRICLRQKWSNTLRA